MMTRLLPAVVLFPHDVAVDTGLWVVAQVREALGVAAGEGPRAERDAG